MPHSSTRNILLDVTLVIYNLTRLIVLLVHLVTMKVAHDDGEFPKLVPPTPIKNSAYAPAFSTPTWKWDHASECIPAAKMLVTIVLSNVQCSTKHTIGHIGDGFLRVKW